MHPPASVDSPADAVWSTSLSLLDRVRANEAAGWRRLADFYGPLVFRWCRRWGLSEADAADVGQEVFQSVFRSLDQFQRRDRTGAFRSWLKTIARRKACDLWRNRSEEPLIDGAAVERQFAQAEPEQETDEETDTALLYRRALELIRVDFAEATWRAFLAVVVEERPARDVAAELGITPNAVYIARSRVLTRLRTEFADLIE